MISYDMINRFLKIDSLTIIILYVLLKIFQRWLKFKEFNKQILTDLV